MKTTVEIADPLLREAKQVADKAGVTLRDLLELGLRRELDARKKQTKPFKLRDGSVKGTGVQPGVRIDDGRAMRAYSYMGTMGFPDTVEGINQMLDEMDAEGEGIK
jgi:hypothetical protein